MAVAHCRRARAPSRGFHDRHKAHALCPALTAMLPAPSALLHAGGDARAHLPAMRVHVPQATIERQALLGLGDDDGGPSAGGTYKDKPAARAFAARSPSPSPLLLCLGTSGGLLVLILVARAMEAAFEGASHRCAAFAMSLGAGMATGLGAALVLFTRSLDRRLLAGTMSFSAGVMLYVSLVEVVGVSNEHFAKSHAPALAYAYATASFFIGAAVMALVDRLVHVVFDMVAGNGHQHSDAATAHGSDGGGVELARARATDEHSRCLPRPGSDGAHGYDHDAALQHELDLEAFEDESGASIRALASVEEKSRLLMMAAVISAAIVLHNIPEGMATYVATYPPCMQVLTTAPSPHRYVASYHSVRAGAPLAIAIAIHNIPEGLAIAMPVFYATQSRWKAVGLGALSGMSEPFGAVLPSQHASAHHGALSPQACPSRLGPCSPRSSPTRSRRPTPSASCLASRAA
jgi:zinc transporter, ZIP family